MEYKILYIRSSLVNYIIHTCCVLYFYLLHLLISERTVNFQNMFVDLSFSFYISNKLCFADFIYLLKNFQLY